jgi:hypothetical protein
LKLIDRTPALVLAPRKHRHRCFGVLAPPLIPVSYGFRPSDAKREHTMHANPNPSGRAADRPTATPHAMTITATSGMRLPSDQAVLLLRREYAFDDV